MPSIIQRFNNALKAFQSPQPLTSSKTFGLYANNDDYVTTLQADKFGCAFVVARNESAFACVNVRMSAIGSSRWRLVDSQGNEVSSSDDRIPRHKFHLALNQFEQKTSANFFELYELALCVAGENYTQLLRDKFTFANGAGIDWLNPLAMQIDAPDGANINGYWFNYGGRSVYLKPDQVAYDRNPIDLRTEVFGHSPLMSAGNTSAIVRQAGLVILKYFQNNAVPGGILMPDGTLFQQFSDDQQNTIQRAVNRNHRGVNNSSRLAVFPYLMQLQTFDQPDLSQWVEMIKELESEIFLAFGVPRSIAGDSDTTRYQSSPNDRKTFNQTVRNELKNIQRSVNTKIMPFFGDDGISFEFDYSEYTEINTESADLIQQAYINGTATVNEYRIAIGLDAIPNGDVYALPAGVTFATDFITAPAPTVNETPPPTFEPPTVAPPEPPSQASLMLDESKKWYDVHKRHGLNRSLAFKCEYLPDIMQHDIRMSLSRGDNQVFKRWLAVMRNDATVLDYPDVTKALKAELDALGYRLNDQHKTSILNQFTLDHYAQKSIGSTRLEFFEVVSKLFMEAVNGEVSRDNFEARLTDAVETAVKRAYRDGMQVAGIRAPTIGKEELDWIYTWMTTQRGYIQNVTSAIYDDGLVTQKEAESKDELWYNHSVYPAYLQGLTKAPTVMLFQWRLGNTEQHCDSCLALNGQVRSMRFWNDNIMPKSTELQCTGMRCDCELEPMPKGAKPSAGNLPRWQYAKD